MADVAARAGDIGQMSSRDIDEATRAANAGPGPPTQPTAVMPPPPSAPDGPTAGLVLAGRYRLVRHVASGGMGAVWEAADTLLQRRVAIKIPHAHLAADPAFRERFRREAIAAARCSDPGIVATFDAGIEGDRAFLVMELVLGRTVRELLHASGPLDAAAAIGIVGQAARAVAAAHRAGMVHRDLKPANLLLVESVGTTPRVKVADFGVARMAGQLPDHGSLAHDHEAHGPPTAVGLVVGTARYLAPEQVSGLTVDARADVYALGIVLWELLCGAPPFVRGSDLGTALAQLQDPLPPLPERCAGLDPRVVTLLNDCLAKDPALRPRTAEHLADRLADIAMTPAQAPLVDATVAMTVPADVARAAGVAMATPGGSDAGCGALLPSRKRTVPRRSRAPFVIATGLAAASVITVVAIVAKSPESAPAVAPATPRATVAGTALHPTIASVQSFDPPDRRGSQRGGDGHEGDDRLANLVDGDPATSWQTDRYSGPKFGGLKAGVGVVLLLTQRATIGAILIEGPTTGWSAQVYVSDHVGATIGDWGTPVATRTNVDASWQVNLSGRAGAAVLLWITDTGPKNQVEISELSLT